MDRANNDGPFLFSVTGVTRVTGLSRTAIYNEMGRGTLPYSYYGSKRMIAREDVVTFVDRIRAGDLQPA